MTTQPRIDLIIDNDFGGDPDGLFQLAHHILSPSVNIKVIVNSHVRPGDDMWPIAGDSITQSLALVDQTQQLLGSNYPSFPGAVERAGGGVVAPQTETIDHLRELLAATSETIYYACGGPLSQLAHLLATKPKNVDALRLVWIGGAEHEGPGHYPPGAGSMEYNFAADPEAAVSVFSETALEIWQVPRNSYRKAVVSFAELERRLADTPLEEFLLRKLVEVRERGLSLGINIGETYCLGDNPLVLLTALLNPFEPDPSTSQFTETTEQTLLQLDGTYEPGSRGARRRVFGALDNRLMFEDMFSKLKKGSL